MTSQDIKVIKKYDNEGSPMTMVASVYKGETLNHDSHFVTMPQTIENLQTFELNNSDVWLMSYPKSGTHWIYEIIGILLNGKQQPHSSYMLPSLIEMNPDIRNIKQTSKPRQYTTHLRSKYIPKTLTEKCKIIYLVRNPKSVALSWHHFVLNLTSLDYSGTFNGFLPFYTEGIFNIWGNWFDHVSEYWQLAQERENIMVVFYEDLVKDTSSQIKLVSDFLRLNHSKEFCDEVSKLASFRNMKEGNGKSKEVMEEAGSYYKENGPKLFRKGLIDEWKDIFTVAQNEMFEEVYHKKMDQFPELLDKISFS